MQPYDYFYPPWYVYACSDLYVIKYESADTGVPFSD